MLLPCPVDWKNTKGQSGLWLATDKNNYDLMVLFILYGAEVDAEDLNGQTPLMKAVINDCFNCVQQPSNIGNTAVMFAAQTSASILTIFMEKKIELSQRNKQSLTALMLAVKANHPAAVKILLEAGANPRRRNEMGQNAFDLGSDHPQLLTLLENTRVCLSFILLIRYGKPGQNPLQRSTVNQLTVDPE